MKRRWLVLPLVAAGTLGLAWLAMDLVRQAFLIPLRSVYILLLGLYQSLDQRTAWIFFVLLLAFLAVGSLVRVRRVTSVEGDLEGEHVGRVALIAGWLAHADKGDYFRWRVARRLSQLAVNLLAHASGEDDQALQQQIMNGKLEAPPQVQAYLRAGLRARSIGLSSPGGSASPLDLPPAVVVDFLEAHLEGVEREVAVDE